MSAASPAVQFLNLIFDPGDRVCIAAKRGDEEHFETGFGPREELCGDEYLDKLAVKNNAGKNIYVAMNSITPGATRRRKEDIGEIRSAYLDLDSKGKEKLDIIVSSTDVPRPTVVLESSPGKYQVIWNVRGITKEQQEGLLRALVSKFGGDPTVKDCSRVLRLPGFVNNKYADAPMVNIVFADENRRVYGLQDFNIEISEVTETRVTPAPIPTEDSGLVVSIDPELTISEARDNALVSIAGSLRNHNCSRNEIKDVLCKLVDDHVVQREGDRKTYEDVKRITNSVSRDSYAPSQESSAPTVIIGGKVIIPGEGTVLTGLHITRDGKVEEIRKAVSTRVDTKHEDVTKTCFDYFRSVGEMESGEIEMVIDGVLQEGICFIGANPGSGKTLVALSLAKAVSTGKPLFGLDSYAVKKPRQVIYLIPESGDHAFRKRCEAFGIPDDKRKFMARTISCGVPLELGDPILLEAVRQTKPVVFLDTASRFMKGNDENAAAQNRQLVNDVVALLAAGAVTVVLVHHATKKSKKEVMSLENMLRGSSDLGAMCDQAYGIRKDDVLYANGMGPMEIDVVNLKDREQIGGLTSLRLAASYTTNHSVGAVSYINTEGDFKVINNQEVRQRLEDLLVKYVTEDPTAPDAEIAEELGLTKSGRTVRRLLNKLGWHRVGGGPEGASPWHNDDGKPCPYQKELDDAKAAKLAEKQAGKETKAAKEAAKAERKRLKFKPSELKEQVTIADFKKPVEGELVEVDPYRKAS